MERENSLALLSRKYHYHYFGGPDYGEEDNYQLKSISLQSTINKKIIGTSKLNFSAGVGLYGLLNLNGGDNYTRYGFIVLTGTRKIKFGNSENDDFRKAEAGVMIQARIQYQKVFLNSSYNFSFTNIKKGNAAESWKVYTVGLGYFIF